MLQANRQLVSDEEEDSQRDKVGEQAFYAANLEYGLVHPSLLKWVSENQATDAYDGEHDEPRKGCDQDYNCGIREHLNPPSRHA